MLRRMLLWLALLTQALAPSVSQAQVIVSRPAVLRAAPPALRLFGAIQTYLQQTPAAAYGLARELPTYNGAALRARRTADAAEQDIGFAGQQLDSAAALTFCGTAGGCTVTTVYDQTGGGRHLTQPTAASQPSLWLGEGGPTITDYSGTAPLLIPASLTIDRANSAVFMVTRTPGLGATDGYWAWGTSAVDFGITSPRVNGQLAAQPMIAGTSLSATSANAQANPVANVSIVGLVSSASKMVVHRDEQTAQYAATTSLSLTAGGQVGEAITFDGRNDWRGFVVYSTAPSDADVLSIKAALRTIFTTAAPATESWLFQGDSIVFGTGGVYNGTITRAYEYRSNPSVLLRNRAIAGHQLSQHYQDYDTPSAAWLTPGVTNVYVADYGHNDIKSLVTSNAAISTTVASMQTQLKAMCAKLRAYGFDVIIWQEAFADTSSGWTADMETARGQWNAWLRTFPTADDGLPCFDSLDRVASDDAFPLSDAETAANRGMRLTVNSSDGIHPNEAMSPARATHLKAVRDALTMTLKYAPVTIANQGSAYTGAAPRTILGKAPLAYTLAPSSAALPAGLTLASATGVISGTPTTLGTSSGIALRVTDATGATADSTPFSITVAAAQQVVVQNITDSYSATDVTSFGASLPATIDAGDLLVAVVASDGNSTISWDGTTAGTWTQQFNDVQTANRLMIFSKIADGSEDGKTLTVGVSGAQQLVVRVFRLTGAQGSLTVSATGVRATSTAPDPASVTAAWGSANNLFIGIAGLDNATSITAGPSGYSAPSTLITSASGQAGLTTAYRSASTATDDPGTFTSSTSIPWIAATIAVRPN